MRRRPLIESVAFDSPMEISDGSFGTEAGWNEEFRARAEFIYQRGSEAVDAARLSGKAVYKLRVHNSASIKQVTSGWRMRDLRRQQKGSAGTYLSGAYSVVEIDTITDRKWAFLVVESGVAI